MTPSIQHAGVHSHAVPRPRRHPVGARVAPVHAAPRPPRRARSPCSNASSSRRRKPPASACVATFRDLDDPDRFVWMRGFPDLSARADALAAFYGGPAWKDATATRPTPRWSTPTTCCCCARSVATRGLQAALQPRQPVDAAASAGGVFTITVCPLRAPATDALVHAFDRCIHPWWVGVGGDLLACWVTEPAANNFPRLPVREGEPVIAWITRFDDEMPRSCATPRCCRPRAASNAPSGAPFFPARRPSFASHPPPARRCVAVTTEREPHTMTEQFIGRPHDFDFLVGGTWHVANRSLRRRLDGGTPDEWQEFEHTFRAQVLMDGQVSIDENVFASRCFTGLTFRSLDVAAQQWAIYWINSKDGRRPAAGAGRLGRRPRRVLWRRRGRRPAGARALPVGAPRRGPRRAGRRTSRSSARTAPPTARGRRTG